MDQCRSEREVANFNQLIAEVLPGLMHDLLSSGQGRLYRAVLTLVERPLLSLALEATGGKQIRAAKLLNWPSPAEKMGGRGPGGGSVMRPARGSGILHFRASLLAATPPSFRVSSDPRPFS